MSAGFYKLICSTWPMMARLISKAFVRPERCRTELFNVYFWHTTIHIPSVGNKGAGMVLALRAECRFSAIIGYDKNEPIVDTPIHH
jgi:hypothetical protein